MWKLVVAAFAVMQGQSSAMPHHSASGRTAGRGGGGLVSHRGRGRTASWCWGKQLLSGEGRAHYTEEVINEARIELGVSRGAEFRGSYRDLTLWVENSRSEVQHCETFAPHHQGNDGLWIVEYDERKMLVKELQRMRELGVPILLEHELTVVIGGGESAPDTLGYDACGLDVDLRFISVPASNVKGPKGMSKESKDRYMRLATDKSKRMNFLDLVDQENLVEMIASMESYHTRNSFSGDGPAGDDGLNQAADWAEEKFREVGCVVTRPAFRDDMTPQVVCDILGAAQPEVVVVVGAHYDSRGTQSTSPTQRAPGADDNGSGSAALIEFARVIQASGTTFRHTLRLMLFTGEEQGLIGSRNLASQYASEGQNIIAMFNADMIGYKRPNFDITLAYMNRFVDMDLTEVSMEITRTFVPELPVDFTSGCCSDQQSFYRIGSLLPAVPHIGRPAREPGTSTDLSDGEGHDGLGRSVG
jgi:hypothetical protein